MKKRFILFNNETSTATIYFSIPELYKFFPWKTAIFVDNQISDVIEMYTFDNLTNGFEDIKHVNIICRENESKRKNIYKLVVNNRLLNKDDMKSTVEFK